MCRLLAPLSKRQKITCTLYMVLILAETEVLCLVVCDVLLAATSLSGRPVLIMLSMWSGRACLHGASFACLCRVSGRSMMPCLLNQCWGLIALPVGVWLGKTTYLLCLFSSIFKSYPRPSIFFLSSFQSNSHVEGYVLWADDCCMRRDYTRMGECLLFGWCWIVLHKDG